MEDIKLGNSKIDVLEWGSLLLPDELSEKDQEKHETAISRYQDKVFVSASINEQDTEKIVNVTVDDSLLETEDVELESMSHDELSAMMREESIVIDSNILFPKFEEINTLFWFLHNLGKEKIEDSIILFSNREQLTLQFFQLVEGAVFFQFLDRGNLGDDIVYVPTEQYKTFLNEDIESQYHIFLKSMSENQTISEILTIQLNVPVYDRISKQMVHTKLANDNNIIREGLSSKEIDNIVNKLRYWYLGIRKAVLES